jgi:hypothetical protein
MPHANPGEAFVWRATSRPERARLIGAIAIALSCGSLGVLAGRWSVRPQPAEPASRTAQLIEAVSQETRAKGTAAASAVTPAREAEPTPAAGAAGSEQAADAVATTPAATPQPAAPIKPASAVPTTHEPKAAEAVKAAPATAPEARTPLKPAIAASRSSEHDGFQMQASPGRAPASRPGPPGRENERGAGNDKPSAPDYRALRDYVLSR